MDLLHLRYFVAVADELNFSQAARKLHMAASPLSRRIKELERELGHDLFERTTHKVALTPAGASLLPMARDVLERVNSIPWRLRRAVRPEHETLLIGMPAGLHPELRDRVRRLTDACREECELRRWPGRSAALAAAVRDGRLALTLARLPLSEPALECVEVMSERLGAVVPADRFEGRDSVTLDDLADLSYVPAPGDAAPKHFEEIDARLHSAGIRKRLRINTADYSGISELISSGIAFSVSMLSPRNPIHRYRLENVTALPIEDFEASLVTALLFRRDRAAPGGDLEGLVAHAREIFADTPSD